MDQTENGLLMLITFQRSLALTILTHNNTPVNMIFFQSSSIYIYICVCVFLGERVGFSLATVI